MRAAGIIAEYNPFHKGHEYHIRETKHRTGCDFLVVVTSGNYVQRGVPAIFDADFRAELALRSGADLCLALPYFVSTASAELFADGACRLLDGLGAVTDLSFGVEQIIGMASVDDLLPQLKELSLLLSNEPPELSAYLKTALSQGYSYPVARRQAVAAFCPALAPLLDTPNNLLAIEYQKALHRIGSKMACSPVFRKASDYHDDTLQEFASATALRTALASQTDFSVCVPAPLLPLYNERLATMKKPCLFPDMEGFATLLFAKLAANRAELETYADVSTELANRLRTLAGNPFTLDDLANELKTRQFTRTRIDRALLHILLDYTKEDETEVRRQLPYSRVLGCSKAFAPYLGGLVSASKTPLLVRPSKDSSLLPDNARRLYQKEELANALYRQLTYQATGIVLPSETKRHFQPIARIE